MRAAVFEDVKKIVYKEDYPKPIPGPDEVLVKVHYCAICGSDITNFKYKLYQTPLIMGHEFSGEVEELGSNIKAFNIGDKVTGVNIIPEGRYEKISGIGVFRNGGFAEYVKIPKDDLFHTPKNVSLKECSLIEPFAVCIRAMKSSDIKHKQNIVIIGGGNLGLTTLNLLLCEKDPNYVIIVEPHEFLRNKAIEMGATGAFPPNKVKIRRFFKSNGLPSIIFECSGNENGLKLGMELVKRGGTIISEGIFRNNISFPIFLLNSKELTITGTISHSREDVLDTIELFSKQKVDLAKFISEVIPLDGIQRAFEKFLEPGERKFIKILVKI
jgi:threonine dehydrogenase-like Zn-dependent dehydrogenase